MYNNIIKVHSFHEDFHFVFISTIMSVITIKATLPLAFTNPLSTYVATSMPITAGTEQEQIFDVLQII